MDGEEGEEEEEKKEEKKERKKNLAMGNFLTERERKKLISDESKHV